MSTYLIRVERDSVSMGDDVNAPHEYAFNLTESSGLGDIFVHLEKKRYLPGVAGKNHSWDAVIGQKKVAHFKGNNKFPEPSKVLSKLLSKFAKDGQVNVSFTYNSSTT